MCPEHTKNTQRGDDSPLQDLSFVLGDEFGWWRCLVDHVHIRRLKKNVEQAALEPTDVRRVERVKTLSLNDEAASPLLEGVTGPDPRAESLSLADVDAQNGVLSDGLAEKQVDANRIPVVCECSKRVALKE